MSLINDVLQQLDHREPGDAVIPAQVLTGHFQPVLAPKIPWGKMSVALVFIASGFILGHIPLHSLISAGPQAPKNVALAAGSLAPKTHEINSPEHALAGANSNSSPVNLAAPAAAPIEVVATNLTAANSDTHHLLSANIIASNAVPLVDQADQAAAVEIANKIDTILQDANALLAADKLMQPLGNNAFTLFRQVLLLDINNIAAQEGIEAIKKRYQILFDHAIASGEINKAQAFLERMQVAGVAANQLQILAKNLELAVLNKAKQEPLLSAEDKNLVAVANDQATSIKSLSPQQNYEDTGVVTKIDDGLQLLGEETDPVTVGPALTTLGDSRQEDKQLAKQALAGRLAHAEQVLTQFIARNKEAPEASFALAQLYAQEKNSQRLDVFLQHGNLPLPRKNYVLAKNAISRGDYSAALSKLQTTSPEPAWQPEHQRLLAVALQNTLQFSAASQEYQQLLQTQSTNASLWLGLAVCEDAQHNRPGALNAFNRSYELGGHADSVRQYIQQRISVLSN